MKIQKKFILVLSLFLLSCSTNQESEHKIYHIIKHSKTLVEKSGTDDLPPPPLPPLIYYGNYNFILIDSATIFYHMYKEKGSCFPEIDYPKPPLMFLTPDSLFTVRIDDLGEFLNGTVSEAISKDRHFNASISSPTDTIRNRAFEIITEYFRGKKMRFYNIRNWTEEEQYVVEAKIENKIYDASKVNWKVGFETNYAPTQ